MVTLIDFKDENDIDKPIALLGRSSFRGEHDIQWPEDPFDVRVFDRQHRQTMPGEQENKWNLGCTFIVQFHSFYPVSLA